jgi:hypothetical protein
VAYDEKAANRVRRLLGNRQDVIEMKMMGGLIFMVGGHMCCGVKRAELIVRVGREAYEVVLGEPHVRPLGFAGPRQPRGFVIVDAAGYRTEAALAKWIGRGLDFVSTLPPKTPASRKKR